MPTPREHIQRARQNLAFAQSFDLKTTPYIDWVPAAYFYSALHWVDALICEKEKIPAVGEAHEIRKRYVVNKDYLCGIKFQYKTLKDYSEDARYRLITMTSTKIEKIVIPYYREIERHILSQLSK